MGGESGGRLQTVDLYYVVLYEMERRTDGKPTVSKSKGHRTGTETDRHSTRNHHPNTLSLCLRNERRLVEHGVALKP